MKRCAECKFWWVAAKIKNLVPCIHPDVIEQNQWDMRAKMTTQDEVCERYERSPHYTIRRKLYPKNMRDVQTPDT